MSGNKKLNLSAPTLTIAKPHTFTLTLPLSDTLPIHLTQTDNEGIKKKRVTVTVENLVVTGRTPSPFGTPENSVKYIQHHQKQNEL